MARAFLYCAALPLNAVSRYRRQSSAVMLLTRRSASPGFIFISRLQRYRKSTIDRALRPFRLLSSKAVSTALANVTVLSRLLISSAPTLTHSRALFTRPHPHSNASLATTQPPAHLFLWLSAPQVLPSPYLLSSSWLPYSVWVVKHNFPQKTSEGSIRVRIQIAMVGEACSTGDAIRDNI